jgi:hypothetical protein
MTTLGISQPMMQQTLFNRSPHQRPEHWRRDRSAEHFGGSHIDDLFDFRESYALPELRFTSDGVRTLAPQRFDAINRQSFSRLLERDDFFRIVIPPYLIFVA